MRKLAAVMVFMTGIGLSVKAQNPVAPISASNKDTIREISPTAPLSGIRPDTVPRIDWAHAASVKPAFPFRSFILPGAMIAYGFVTLKTNGFLKNFNGTVKDEIWTDGPHKQIHADNYLMLAPAVSVYALNAMGIHGQHNFRDRTIILLMSSLFTNAVVFGVKGWSHELRPDGSDYNSFPSGHTAEAFASAEFMRQEYKDVSPWYGVAGYAMATATGMLRMYNNKHWMSDVVAGAGVGIASTKLAYWLYPVIKHALWKDKATGPVIMPTYSNGSVGLSFVRQF
ncbi:MAG TPA: phosphatase PAP2 family protein [Puia sp.]|jgi:membrane-associated phospholipid phosphatase|nr:phosphatase PAP2 family protein [Puia sp.]